jgi:hypothetical protein
MANKTITQLDTAQSLNDNMVIAVQDTNTTYKTTLADVKAYCGGGDAYKVGDRVKDDSDNDVGMVSGFFTDADDQKYAVVCLNAADRLASGQYLSSNTTIIGIPEYQDQTLWSASETATTNTTAILATGTSSACTHCRSKSYTIDGVTYAGQLPNLLELIDIFRNRVKINADDPTAATSSSLVIPTKTRTWSSTQFDSSGGWCVGGYGSVSYDGSKVNPYFTIPVLEIPLED